MKDFDNGFSVFRGKSETQVPGFLPLGSVRMSEYGFHLASSQFDGIRIIPMPPITGNSLTIGCPARRPWPAYIDHLH